jgi:hypothetical protein
MVYPLPEILLIVQCGTMVLGQEAVAAKPNEIIAIPQLDGSKNLAEFAVF